MERNSHTKRLCLNSLHRLPPRPRWVNVDLWRGRWVHFDISKVRRIHFDININVNVRKAGRIHVNIDHNININIRRTGRNDDINGFDGRSDVFARLVSSNLSFFFPAALIKGTLARTRKQQQVNFSTYILSGVQSACMWLLSWWCSLPTQHSPFHCLCWRCGPCSGKAKSGD